MTVHAIEYAELYVRDLKSACEYFVRSMGFTHIADSKREDSMSVLLRQGDVQLVVTTGPVTSNFLSERGDGIVDIALACDDVDAARAAAEAAGAQVAIIDGHARVFGFGSVSHSLYPVREDGGANLPIHRKWTIKAAVPLRPAGRVRLLDHVAICVRGGTLGTVADFYCDGLGLSRYFGEYVDVGGQGMESIVMRSNSGNVTLTLVAPDPGKNPGQLDAFLDRYAGPGVQHLAFQVDDILSAVEQFQTLGVTFLTTPAAYYDMLADWFPEVGQEEISALRKANVLADRDEWGYLLQLFSRSPYERNTLFYELIQRRGSRGFGSRNIRALYEAVERDRLGTE